jgi:6,7-dimethyl-8-ribityllumazine synthase
MSDDENHEEDWPLREWSARLRPPGRSEPVEEPDPAPEPLAGVIEEEPAVEEEEEEPAVEEDEAEEPEPSPPDGAAEGEAEPAAGSAVAEAEPEIDQHADGELDIPDGYAVLEGAPVGHRRSVAIVVSRFNGEITNRLLDSALDELDEAGVNRDAVLVMPVPGAFELPIAAMALAKTRRYACVIALGCIIRGETAHFDFVASEAASGLQLAGIETGVPVSFGVLTCDTAEQAAARVDRGADAARAALEMADAFAQLRTTATR